jgi:hypothetical protein
MIHIMYYIFTSAKIALHSQLSAVVYRDTLHLLIADKLINMQVSQPKEGNRWLRFSGLSVVAAAWHNLFSRQRSKPSPPPAAASAASSQP